MFFGQTKSTSTTSTEFLHFPEHTEHREVTAEGGTKITRVYKDVKHSDGKLPDELFEDLGKTFDLNLGRGESHAVKSPARSPVSSPVHRSPANTPHHSRPSRSPRSSPGTTTIQNSREVTAEGGTKITRVYKDVKHSDGKLPDELFEDLGKTFDLNLGRGESHAVKSPARSPVSSPVLRSPANTPHHSRPSRSPRSSPGTTTIQNSREVTAEGGTKITTTKVFKRGKLSNIKGIPDWLIDDLEETFDIDFGRDETHKIPSHRSPANTPHESRPSRSPVTRSPARSPVHRSPANTPKRPRSPAHRSSANTPHKPSPSVVRSPVSSPRPKSTMPGVPSDYVWDNRENAYLKETKDERRTINKISECDEKMKKPFPPQDSKPIPRNLYKMFKKLLSHNPGRAVPYQTTVHIFKVEIIWKFWARMERRLRLKMVVRESEVIDMLEEVVSDFFKKENMLSDKKQIKGWVNRALYFMLMYPSEVEKPADPVPQFLKDIFSEMIVEKRGDITPLGMTRKTFKQDFIYVIWERIVEKLEVDKIDEGKLTSKKVTKLKSKIKNIIRKVVREYYKSIGEDVVSSSKRDRWRDQILYFMATYSYEVIPPEELPEPQFTMQKTPKLRVPIHKPAPSPKGPRPARSPARSPRPRTPARSPVHRTPPARSPGKSSIRPIPYPLPSEEGKKGVGPQTRAQLLSVVGENIISNLWDRIDPDCSKQ